ncbi:MAG: efflux transporter outer membrane subunit [Rhizomicrobium sp.]
MRNNKRADRQIKHFLLVLALGGGLCACTQGPDYVRPADAAISKADKAPSFQEAAGQGFTQGETPSDWWHLYNDPVLDDLIKDALRNNADLKMAAANIRKVQAVLSQTKDKQLPQTRISAAPGYGQMSAEEHLIFGSPLSSNFTYDLEGALSYQIDLFGEVQRAVEAADANVSASQAAYNTVRIGIIAETTRAYLEACSSGHQIAIATDISKMQHQLGALNDRMIAAGRGLPTSHNLFSVQDARTRASIPVLDARQKAAGYRLAALIGVLPGQLPAQVLHCQQPPVLDRPIPTGDGRALLRRRPDVREAEDTLHAATASIGVATADLYPKISLGLSGGSLGLDRYFLHSDTLKYSIGPLISWDFPNLGAARARIRFAEAGADAAYANFDKVVLAALRDTETALSAYSRDLQRNAELRQAVQSRAQYRQDADELHKLGRANVVTQLEANRDYLTAEQELAESDARLLDDQVQLFHTLGGGW